MIYILPGVEVRPEVTPPGEKPLDVTLIGAPVISQVVAGIDYTARKELSGYNFYPGLKDPDSSGILGFRIFNTVYGPDITFFPADDPAIPYSEFGLFLELGRWGMPERYNIKNVVFKRGTYSIDDTGLVGGKVLHYDTGTTRTIINDDIASQLHLNSASSSFDCFNDGDNLGYVIDEVTFTAPNGTYTVQNAAVCWDESMIHLLAD